MDIITSLFLLIVTLLTSLAAIIGLTEAPPSAHYEGAKETHREPVSSLQKNVLQKYKQYKLPKVSPSFAEFCFPTKYKLQPPQKFLSEWMAPNSSNNELLAYHRIGAGKTCAIISMAEKYINIGDKPIVLMPASLLPGFKNELRSECPTFKYISDSERNQLKTLGASSVQYKDIIKRSNELIATRYQLFSYNKFIKLLSESKKSIIIPKILFVDEVQNINNASGSFYAGVMKFINENPKMKVVILSATPVFDNLSELVSLMRLLRIDATENIVNDRDKLKELLQGKISYYGGAPSHVFPKIIMHNDVIKMSKFQSKWYKASIENEISRKGLLTQHDVSDNFYIKSRARSNIVFPRGLAGTDGLPKLTKSKILNLEKFSCKFSKLIKRLKKHQLSFVYTNFTSFGGIKTIRHCLRAFGFIEFNKHGPGPKRFAIWTGEQTPSEKDKIRSTYNSSANDDASQLQIIVGSPAMKEGVSLFRTRQVHVLEPYWNHSRHAQIFGRASRFCSHKSLPARDRTVDIYLYLAVTHESKCTSNNIDKYIQNILPAESVDLYILNIANKKNELISSVNELLKEVAVDRLLNQ